MKSLIGLVATSMAVVFPAFAQEAGTDLSTMTCAEFIVLDNAGQTSAMALIAATAAEAATETDVATAGTDITATGDDATATADNSATEADAAAGMDTATAGDAAASEGEDMTATLVEACSSIPDMRVTDAMMQAQADGAGEVGSMGETEGDAGATESEASGG